jgi:dTDP-4-amino-4,6-dideoxygalactose transaminase
VNRGPLPRFRLYTDPGTYTSAARGLVQGGGRRGDAVERLEAELARGHALPHAIAMPRARAAIYWALRGLIRPGQRVVLSPYTIHEVVNMVIAAGGAPVFADIERRSCNLDPKRALEKLDDGDVGAVLVTHLHGLAMDLRELADACRARGIALVEDCAQALGTHFPDGRPVGTAGDAGILSFGTYKNLTSFTGGALLTPHAELASRARDALRALPPQPLGPWLRELRLALATDVATWPPLFGPITAPIFRFGYLREIEALQKRVRVEDEPRLRREFPEAYACRMRPVQAELLLRRIGRVERDLRARVVFAKAYHEGLRDLPELLLPPLREDGSHGYSYFPIQFSERDALIRHLMRRRCDLAAQHLKNCASLACFAEWRRECPEADVTARSVVLLPTYPRYSLRDVERNIAAIRDFFGRGRARA